MKHFSFLLLTVTLFLSSAFSASAQTVEGFRGVQWGTDISKMKSKFGLKLKEKSGNSIIYSTNVKSVGKARLRFCYFTFYKNKFSDVLMIAQDFSDARNLLDILKEKYGDDESAISDIFTWHTEETTIGYVGDVPKNSATVTMKSDSLDEVIKNDKTQDAKEGAKDF